MTDEAMDLANGLSVDSVDLLLTALPRHRHQLSRETVRSSQQLRLLIAVVDSVAANGYAGATIRDIAKRAGTSTKVFYDIYRDKEQALLASFVAIDIAVAEGQRLAQAEATVEGFFRAAVRNYVEQLLKQPRFAQTLIIEAAAATPAIRARRLQIMTDYAESLVSTAGARYPSAPIDPDFVFMAIAAINELVTRQITRGTDTEPETLARTAENAALLLLGLHPPQADPPTR